jgi:hypothetical protein
MTSEKKEMSAYDIFFDTSARGEDWLFAASDDNFLMTASAVGALTFNPLAPPG